MRVSVTRQGAPIKLSPSQAVSVALKSAPGLVAPPNVLSIGTVTTGAPGSAAAAAVTGAAPNQTLSLTIPRGDQGIQGPPNSLAIGTVTTGAAGSSAAAAVTGAAPNQTLSLTIPRGDQGIQGPPNSLAIGTVTTGAAGSSAAAAVTGAAPNQTLSLTIPRGDQGIQGPKGDTGASGDFLTAANRPTSLSLYNADLGVLSGQTVPDGWNIDQSGGLTGVVLTRVASAISPPGTGVGKITGTGTPAANGTVSTFNKNAGAVGYPVVPGENYVAEGYAVGSGFNSAQIGIHWYDSAGNYISTSNGPVNTIQQGVVSNLSNFTRLSTVATAPSNAASMAWGLSFLAPATGMTANPAGFWTRPRLESLTALLRRVNIIAPAYAYRPKNAASDFNNFRQAIADATDNSEIRLGPGTHILQLKDNGGNPASVIGLSDIPRKNVRIIGYGADLQVDTPTEADYAPLFRPDSWTDLTLEGFKTDHLNNPWTFAQVVSKDTSTKTIVFDVDISKWPFTFTRAFWIYPMNSVGYMNWNTWAMEIGAAYANNGIGLPITTVSTSGNIRRISITGFGTGGTQQFGGGTSADQMANFTVGQFYGIQPQTYGGDVLNGYRLKGTTTMRNVIAGSSPGRYCVTGFCEDLLIVGGRLKPRDWRVRTTTSDGLHLGFGRGVARLIDTHIEATNDDGINCQNEKFKFITIASDGSSFTANTRFGTDFYPDIRPGDGFEIVDQYNSLLYSLGVAAISVSNGTVTIAPSSPIPADVRAAPANFTMQIVLAYRLEIDKTCEISRNRGAGVRVQCRDGRISGRFRDINGHAVICEAGEGSFAEGINTRRVEIKGVNAYNCAYEAVPGTTPWVMLPAIAIQFHTPTGGPGSRGSIYASTDISIENNIIDTSAQQAIGVMGTNNASVCNNTIRRPAQSAAAVSAGLRSFLGCSIALTNCATTTVAFNRQIGSQGSIFEETGTGLSTDGTIFGNVNLDG